MKEEINMCGNQKFFICNHCGNLTGLINNKGVPMVCCGEKMAELVPNTVEASREKHLPFVSSSPGCISVQVGSVPHPMESGHSIAFVYAETERGGQRKCLKAGEDPMIEFFFAEDKPIAVYAYCNLHGLWKTEVKH
jgi:superoxide reductase